MGFEILKQVNKKIENQLDIFTVTAENLEEEKKEKEEIIKRYKVGDPSKLSKKDGTWYFGNETVEDWNKNYSDLEEGEGRDYMRGQY